MRRAQQDADRFVAVDGQHPQTGVEVLLAGVLFEELLVGGREMVPVVDERLIEDPVRGPEVVFRVRGPKQDAGRRGGSVRLDVVEVDLHVPEPARPRVAPPRQQSRARFVLGGRRRVQPSVAARQLGGPALDPSGEGAPDPPPEVMRVHEAEPRQPRGVLGPHLGVSDEVRAVLDDPGVRRRSNRGRAHIRRTSVSLSVGGAPCAASAAAPSRSMGATSPSAGGRSRYPFGMGSGSVMGRYASNCRETMIGADDGGEATAPCVLRPGGVIDITTGGRAILQPNGEVRVQPKTIGIGLVGVGWMGEVHSRAYRRLRAHFPDCAGEPRLVSPPTSPRNAPVTAVDTFGYEEATTDWREVIAHPSVDAVSITSPNFLHREMALAAIEAGKAIWVEKPVGGVAAETAEVAAAAAKAGTISTVGLNYRQVPAVRHARDLIAAGALGDVNHFRFQFLASYASNPLGALSWRFSRKLAGAGVIADLGSHAVDLLQFLLGPVSEPGPPPRSSSPAGPPSSPERARTSPSSSTRPSSARWRTRTGAPRRSSSGAASAARSS